MDTNVFDEGRKGPYGFDIAPRFWQLMDELSEAGEISCPILVHDELRESEEEMANWAATFR